jgi:hypothetical protein
MIVNVKVKYIRPEYNNLKKWMEDPDNVYIGRGRVVFIDGERFPQQDSKWCNPFKGEGCIEKFEKYLLTFPDSDFEELKKLKGKKLGCWCKPDRCHGDVLLKYINNANESR